jgi:hypothetical protein
MEIVGKDLDGSPKKVKVGAGVTGKAVTVKMELPGSGRQVVTFYLGGGGKFGNDYVLKSLFGRWYFWREKFPHLEGVLTEGCKGYIQEARTRLFEKLLMEEAEKRPEDVERLCRPVLDAYATAATGMAVQKQKKHGNRVATSRIRKALAKALDDGLTREEIVRILDEVIVEKVMKG